MTTTRAARAGRAPGEYRDQGCHLWHSCLSCIFERCAYDEPMGPRRAKHEARDAEIRRRRAAGESVIALTTAFHVTRRTIYRALGDVERRPEDDGRTARAKYARYGEAKA